VEHGGVDQEQIYCIDVIVGDESTGPYAEPLVQYLMDKGCINNTFLKLSRGAEHMLLLAFTKCGEENHRSSIRNSICYP